MPVITPIHSPLTDSDITRLPQGTINMPHAAAIQNLSADTAEISGKNKSHSLRNTIIGLVIAAAAVVGLKHCSFMEVKNINDMKWYDHIKSWNNKLGEWIEKPFKWICNKFSGGHKSA